MKQRHRSQGVTLVIVMIFLVLVSVLSISAFRSSTSNLRVTQNMTARQEATAAAQAAIETTISTPAFQAASAAVTTTVNVDVDGDGSTDYAVTVTPADSCASIRKLQNAELPRDASTGLPKTAWIRCDSGRSGSAVGSGAGGAGLIEGGSAAPASTGASYCVETLWNVQADAVDARTGTAVQINQGVVVPYSIGVAQDRCTRQP